MKYMSKLFVAMLFLSSLQAEVMQKVVDIPTRSGVTQRMLLLTPTNPKAVLVLLAGGHGGLQIAEDGAIGWGKGNFLLRVRQQFAELGFIVAIVDAPSDRQSNPFLQGFRQTSEHVADVKAILSWFKESSSLPLWLVGTSRGTQSAAYVATELLGKEAPDGIVLTSTILVDKKSNPVPNMNLEKIKTPVLVVHHELDGCQLCSFDEIPRLMRKLENVPKKELFSFKEGQTKGDPCDAFGYHGFNGIESEVVTQIATWILQNNTKD